MRQTSWKINKLKAMKYLTTIIAVVILMTFCASCGKEAKGLKEEIKALKEENSYLKAENIGLKKEVEELYKKIEEKETAKARELQKEKEASQEPSKLKKPENEKVKR